MAWQTTDKKWHVVLDGDDVFASEYYAPWAELSLDEDDQSRRWEKIVLDEFAKEVDREKSSRGDVYDLPEAEQAKRLRAILNRLMENPPASLSLPPNPERIVRAILDDQYRMGPVQELWENKWVSDIQIFVPWDKSFPQFINYVERGERKEFRGPGFRDYDHAKDWVNRHLSRIGLHYDPGDVQIDGMFPNGERIHVISGPAGYSVFTVKGDEVEYHFVRCMIISIRRFVHGFSLDDLTDKNPPSLTPPVVLTKTSQITWERRTVYTQYSGGMIDRATRDFIAAMTKLDRNHIFSGGTGAGKTTLANAGTAEIAAYVVLLILEEAPEMQPQRSHGVIRIYERRGVTAGNPFTIADGMKGALRMFPDRIFIAELRDAIAYTFLDAIQSGHDGSSTTVHAGSCAATIRRIVSMAAQHPSAPDRDAIEEIIYDRIDTIIHIKRVGKRRFVDEVVQLLPDRTMHKVMEFVECGRDEEGGPVGYWTFYGPTDEFVQDMLRRGMDIPNSWQWVIGKGDGA